MLSHRVYRIAHIGTDTDGGHYAHRSRIAKDRFATIPACNLSVRSRPLIGGNAPPLRSSKAARSETGTERSEEPDSAGE